MNLHKDAKRFLIFEKSYWNYFLELEKQLLSTRRYVAFDVANYKTYSMEYLKLIEAVCSEIDVVGKEIAHQIDPGFNVSDNSSTIQKWWYIIQDWYSEENVEPIKMLDELEFSPWDGYRIEEFVDKRGAKRLRLAESSKLHIGGLLIIRLNITEHWTIRRHRSSIFTGQIWVICAMPFQLCICWKRNI